MFDGVYCNRLWIYSIWDGEGVVKMFGEKKKVYVGHVMLGKSDVNDFSEAVHEAINDFQNKGYEVEVKYQLTTFYSALILAYEVK